MNITCANIPFLFSLLISYNDGYYPRSNPFLFCLKNCYNSDHYICYQALTIQPQR